MLNLCGIADRLVLKVLLDAFGRLGELTEMTDCGLLQLPLGSGGCFRSHRLLEVGVQALVGIELRATISAPLIGLAFNPWSRSAEVKPGSVEISIVIRASPGGSLGGRSIFKPSLFCDSAVQPERRHSAILAEYKPLAAASGVPANSPPGRLTG